MTFMGYSIPNEIVVTEFDTHAIYSCGCVQPKTGNQSLQKICLKHSPVETLLWSDLQNDDQRIEFIEKGLAEKTGIVAPAIVPELIEVFKFRKVAMDREEKNK